MFSLLGCRPRVFPRADLVPSIGGQGIDVGQSIKGIYVRQGIVLIGRL